jgi:hypothetical protein
MCLKCCMREQAPSLLFGTQSAHHLSFLNGGSLCVLNAGLWIRIRIGSVFNRVCGSGSGFGIRIRIRIQEGKNDPQK